MLPPCDVYGNTDLYGLGVRIGYYLQWLSLLFGAWICPREVPKLRIANTFYISAIFFALVLQIRDDTLDDVDIYVTLLFTFGPTIYTCIFLACHIVASCNTRWDLSRHSRVKPAGVLFMLLQAVLLIAQFGFQIWFWAIRLRHSSHDDCIQYAFHFGRVKLHDIKFRFFNVGMSLLALLLTITYIFFKLKPTMFASSLTNAAEATIIPSKFKPFLVLSIGSNLSVAITTIIATELCIRWNKINGVTSINSAGQTVPLLLGIACSVRVAYVGARSMLEDKTSSPTTNTHELAAALLDDVETSVTDDNTYPLQRLDNSTHNSDPIDTDDLFNNSDSVQAKSTGQELTSLVATQTGRSQRNSRSRSKNVPPVDYQKRIAPESPTYMFSRTYNKIKVKDNAQHAPKLHTAPTPIINDTNDVAIHNPLPVSKTPSKTVTVHEHISVYEPRTAAFTSAIESRRSTVSATDYTGLYVVRGPRRVPVVHNGGGQSMDPNTSSSAANSGYYA